MNSHSSLRWLAKPAAAILLLLALFVPPSVLAQSAFPSRPVTLIVPIAAGSAVDSVARVIAQKVGENWGHQILVENRPGASAAIGMEMAAKAAPDGYTLVIAGTSQLLSPLVSKVRFDILRDFTPVALSGSLPYVLAVPNTLPVKSLRELVDLAKSRPGKMNYAALTGSVPHFMGEAFKTARGIDVMMVPYNSTSDAQADVVSGRVEIWLTPMTTALPLLMSDRVKILGITGNSRSTALPDVPTMAEAGFPELDVNVGLFILAPVGSPKSIVTLLSNEIQKALDSKDVKTRLVTAGVEPVSSTPAELEALLKSESLRWSMIAKSSGFRPQ